MDRTLAALRGLFFAACAVCATVATAAGATYYVDNQNTNAADTNPGTLTAPYRTIAAAVSQHGGAGNTILVRPGTYREQVSVGSSGAAGNPFTIQAAAAGVTVDAADDFGSTPQWIQYSGNVWRASGVTWSPLQVFANGSRLSASTASLGSIPAGSYEYSSGSGLYVNVGGGNPGTHQVRASHRSYGFTLSSRSYVTISGFTMAAAESKGIDLSSCSNCVISGNVVGYAGSHGIAASGGSSLTIDGNAVYQTLDHGIYLTNGVTGSVVSNNESFLNARPATRAANGIHLYGSSNNRVEHNRLHDNQDSGLQINNGANNNVCLENMSWNNGDHGYDHLGSSGTIHIGDVAYGNYKDGFSLEGGSPNGRIYNCIAIDNGLTTNEFDLWVDDQSFSGFASDYNIFWNSNTNATVPIKIGSSQYSTISAYTAARGQDSHGIQANPRFGNAAAGDFHLTAGSPAIDAANASVPNWPALDADNHARYDDPGTPNTGTGPVTYADRGALEFNGTTAGTPPTAALVITPSSGQAPLAVTADASGSSDPDGPIASYRFDFGDGVVVGPQPGATAPHTYSTGTWTARVTVTDQSGLTGTASATVTVSRGADQAPVVSAPATATVNESSTLTVNVTASDPDGDPITSLTADVSGLPAGNTPTFTVGGGNTSGTLTWTPTSTNAGTYSVTFRAANALAGTATTTITVNNVDRAPVVTAPSTVRGRPGSPITFTVTASDPDGDAITSLTANLSGLPSQGSFTPNATNTSGTFSWTPGSGQNGNYQVTFTARNALTASASTTVQVRKNAPVAMVEVVGDVSLSSGYPNPASEDVSFALQLPDAAHVDWTVYDLHGRAVWQESSRLEPGTHALRWSGRTRDGLRAGAGLYYARVRVDGATYVRRIVRL